MTTFRFSHFLLVPALLLTISVSGGTAAAQEARSADNCSNVDPSTVRACIDARLARKEGSLDQLLVRARATVGRSFGKHGRSDNRTNPQFLDQSQSAWRRYIDANCKVSAAFGGGSNSAISDRETECYEQELDRRMTFLRTLIEEEQGKGL